MEKNKLRYVLLVTGPAYGTQQSSSALQFAKALLVAEHQLMCVFFYREGIYNANHFILPAADECNLVHEWQQFSQQHGIPLHICVAASLRRGVVSVQEAEQYQLPAANLSPGFTLSGLGALAEALCQSDRLIQF